MLRSQHVVRWLLDRPDSLTVSSHHTDPLVADPERTVETMREVNILNGEISPKWGDVSEGRAFQRVIAELFWFFWRHIRQSSSI